MYLLPVFRTIAALLLIASAVACSSSDDPPPPPPPETDLEWDSGNWDEKDWQ